TWAPVSPVPDDDGVVERYSQDVPTGYGLSHGPYIRDVLERLSEGSVDVAVGVEEGLKTLKFLHAIYASVETGGWVQLADRPVSSRLGV
ncbi:hypothetical protein N9F34_05615, partial [Alphaproteobacteria bacterium]|nr:hypothetical protein [Alphaproteobacteria bacterium]